MSIYDTLNEDQKKAVFQTEGPVLILAGAGSGKTRTLTHRIAYMIDENGVNPWNILAITFTNKAAGEMRERVDKIVGFGAESIWVSTFHSTCVRILRRYADRLGYDNHFVIYDTDDQKAVIKDICKRLQIDTKNIKERALMGAISSAKDELISPEEYVLRNMGDFSKKVYGDVYMEYQKALKKNNAMDFDDLLVKTVELFKICPEVLEYYQDRFLYIMVDEYQDTNTAQFELIRLLSKKNRNLCVVGDDDQSIYKFRGANIRNILDFEQVYPDATVIKLEKNYRSSQNILDAANSVIRNNTKRKSKQLWTDSDSGNLIHFRQFDTSYEEAEYVVSDIRSKVREGRDYKDCAILYRTNAQSRMLEEKLVIAGMPYNIVGGINFYARKEIKDLLAYLKTIDNGKDDMACKRIINVPKRGIGATTITRVQEYADSRNISFYDALKEANQIMTIGKSYVKLEPFVSMIQVFRSKMEVYSLEELLRDVIETTGYVKEIEESDADTEEIKDRISNINELISKVVAYEEKVEEETGNRATLSGFLEEVALVADIDKVDESDDKVLLMTLHSAKGLEFPVVYMVGVEDGVFPSYRTITSDDMDEMEEERRLAYVGITRAKEDLHILCAKQRMINGETQYNPVSRFVKEIPANLLDSRLPVYKKYDLDDYDEDSYERNTFKAKPYGMSSGSSAYGQMQSTRSAYNIGGTYSGRSAYGNMGNSAATSSYGGSASSSYFARPKAVAKPKTAPDSAKPYIAKATGLAGLTKGNEVAGEKPAYDVGDRVKHVKYGEGEILSLTKGARDYEVTVNFDAAGQKIMYAAFAKLQKI